MHSIVFNFMRKVQLEEIRRKRTRQLFIFGSNFSRIMLSQSTRQPGGEGQEESAIFFCILLEKGIRTKIHVPQLDPLIPDLISIVTCSQEWRVYRVLCNSLTLLSHILIKLRQILFECKQRRKNSNRGLKKKKDFITRIDQNLSTEIIWEVLKYNKDQETLLIGIMI